MRAHADEARSLRLRARTGRGEGGCFGATGQGEPIVGGDELSKGPKPLDCPSGFEPGEVPSSSGSYRVRACVPKESLISESTVELREEIAKRAGLKRGLLAGALGGAAAAALLTYLGMRKG